MTDAYRDQVRLVARWISQAERGVAFTGAGISTESGIPDFRSPSGVWARYRPVYFQEFLASAQARHESWRQKTEAYAQFAQAQPNAGHRCLADWEGRGWLRGVITQNIDGLHQLAGSRRVLELHGTARQVECLGCRRRWPPDPWMDQFRRTQSAPACPDCGGWLKSATVSFGQPLPEEVMSEAVTWARQADLMLALGSSLVVEPAASLPRIARKHGAKLVIINRDATEQDLSADIVIHAGIGETLSLVAEFVAGVNN